MTAVIQLPLLQGMIRKDPISYREEFQLQKHHYQAQMDLLQLKPTQENDQLLELLDFISHTISCYPDEANAFIEQLMTILEESCSLLSPPIRLKIFQSVVTVRNKINYNSIELLKLSFKLLGMNDKVFRAYVTQFIFNDIKTITIAKTNMALYRSIQSFLHKFLSEETSLIAQKSIHILSELYRKRIWTDSKTVNIIASALHNNNTSVFMSSIHFFLGIDTKMLEDEEEEKEKVKKVRDSMNLHEHSKKTRKRLRQVEKQKLKITKLQKQLSEKSNNQNGITTKPLLPAILMIDNPMNISEILFKKLKSSSSSILNFENKLLLMNFLSQLIGCHKLIVLPFYSYLQKYITAHQQNITNVFVYLIQSVHEFIPPMDLLPIIKNIAFHFITERSTEENITLGINTIREILTRNPSILLEEDLKDFIQDLTFYTHKHKKCVVSAARSLINFVREEYPSLLHKSDRGKGTDLKKVPLAFGQERVLDSREILNLGDNNDEEDDDDEGDNESDEEGDDDEGEWEEVEDSDGENEEEDEGEWEEMEDDEEGDGKEEDEDEWESVDEDEEEEEADEDEDETDGKKGVKKSVSFAEDENSESVGLGSKKSKKSKSIRRRLDVDRVLNDSDLQLFEHLKALRQGTLKRSRDEEGDDSEEESEEDYDEDDDDNGRHLPDFMVDPSSILPSSRAGKSSKIDRIKNILSGRSEKKFEHEGHAGGLTNKEKLRKKNYMMVRKGKREVLQKYRRGSADARAAKATQKEVWGRDRRKKRRI